MNYTVDPTIFSNYWEFSLSQPEMLLYGEIVRLVMDPTLKLLGPRNLARPVGRLGVPAVPPDGRGASAHGNYDFSHGGPRDAAVDDISLFYYLGRNARVVILSLLKLFATTGIHSHSFASSRMSNLSRGAPLLKHIRGRLSFTVRLLRRPASLVSSECPDECTVDGPHCVILYPISVTVWNPYDFRLYNIADAHRPIINVLRGALPQIMTAPTLVIVRVGLGRSLEDTDVHPHHQKRGNLLCPDPTGYQLLSNSYLPSSLGPLQLVV
ncbi:hypothetical protein C8R44DRAFT_744171 [Mycena epipterygia]|nr:hypothetical protein C8R44DRAFT_744171 [Mycena epipterygia]